jgi:hypothetical protein
MERISVFSPDPLRMAADSEAELEKPDRHLQQLVSWLRHLSQEQMEIVPSLLAALRETIDCLDGFRLERTGEASRVLKFDFLFSDGEGKTSDKQFTLPFSRMSEGQRNLMALYTVLHAAVTRGATLCIDEPDNYVALREIQPWLIALKDKVADEGSQCLLISHHPELIDYLAPDCGSLFYREAGGPSRAKPFEWKGEDVVRASEIGARGWE